MLIARLDQSLGRIGIRGCECGADILKPDTVFEQRAGIEFDAHGRERGTPDIDLPDALDLRERLLKDVRSDIVELTLRAIGRGQRQNHDRRIGRIALAIARIGAQRCRKIRTRGIDGGLHVARRAVDIAVEPELQHDTRRPLRGGGRHFGDIGDLAQMLFQRPRHIGRHRIRASPGHAGRNRDGRGVDLGQGCHGQLPERDQSGQREGRRDQRRRHRPADEGGGDIHPATPTALSSRSPRMRRARLSKAR